MEFDTNLRDTFEQVLEDGGEVPQTMTVGFHAWLIGRPGRIGALHRYLNHVAGRGDVWIAGQDGITRRCAARHPGPRLGGT